MNNSFEKINEKVNNSTNNSGTNEKNISNNYHEKIAIWKNLKIDFNRFRDIFQDDLPVIIYDILFWSVLINFLNPLTNNNNLNLTIQSVLAIYDI